MKKLLSYLLSGCGHKFEPAGELYYREAFGIFAGDVAVPHLRCRTHRCSKCGSVKEVIEGREDFYNGRPVGR